MKHKKWSYVCEILLTLIHKLSINIVPILQICGFLLNKCWRQQNSLSFSPSLMFPAQTQQILHRMGGGFFETPELWEPRKGSAWLGLKVGFKVWFFFCYPVVFKIYLGILLWNNTFDLLFQFRWICQFLLIGNV